jgi:hypothetical protein
MGWEILIVFGLMGAPAPILPCTEILRNPAWGELQNLPTPSNQFQTTAAKKLFFKKEKLIEIIRFLHSQGHPLRQRDIETMDLSKFTEYFVSRESQILFDPRWQMTPRALVDQIKTQFRSWSRFLREAGLTVKDTGIERGRLEVLSLEKISQIVRHLYQYGVPTHSSGIAKMSTDDLLFYFESGSEIFDLIHNLQVNGLSLVNKVKRETQKPWADFLSDSQLPAQKIRKQLPANAISRDFLMKILMRLDEQNLNFTRQDILDLNHSQLMRLFSEAPPEITTILEKYELDGSQLLYPIRRHFGTWREFLAQAGLDPAKHLQPGHSKVFQNVFSQKELSENSDGSIHGSKYVGRPERAPHERAELDEISQILNLLLRHYEEEQKKEILLRLLQDLDKNHLELSPEKWCQQLAEEFGWKTPFLCLEVFTDLRDLLSSFGRDS